MNKEQAVELVNKHLKQIKKTIKSKVDIYTLDFKITFKRFVQELTANDYEIVKKIPDTGEPENHLTDLIKNFLIRQSYFLRTKEDYIPKVVTNLSKQYKLPFSFRQDIVNAVREKIEEGEFKKIKKFRESSKFTTFLFRVIRNLAIDYVRKYKNINIPEEIPIPPDIIDKFHRSHITPEDFSIRMEEKEIKNRISELLPQKLEKLDFKEKIAFKMHYYEDITNISRIARDLGISHYKADAMIKRTWDKILAEIKKEIEIFLKSKKNPSNKGE